MGQAKRLRKKYKTPPHPWNKTRILQEKELAKEYGLKNKREILRVESRLRNFKRQAKDVISRSDAQSEIEWNQLKDKLTKLGLTTGDLQIETVLDLSVKDLMERRLQTQVVQKGLARSMSQARQFITHGHIAVGSSMLTVPGHLLTVDEEHQIAFIPNSPYADANHPERKLPEELKTTDEAIEEDKEKELEELEEKSEAVVEEATPVETPKEESQPEAVEEAPAEQPAEESKEASEEKTE